MHAGRSAKSSTNVSLNDILIVGPAVHSSLIDILFCFRLHRIAISASVHQFFWSVLDGWSQKYRHGTFCCTPNHSPRKMPNNLTHCLVRTSLTNACWTNSSHSITKLLLYNWMQENSTIDNAKLCHLQTHNSQT